MKPGSSIALALVALLAGCATAETRSIATGGLDAAYELRGPSLTALRSKAQWLCPNGHEVLREWEHAHRPEMESNLAIRWWGIATNVAGIGEHDDAQLMVRCKA